MELSGDNRDLTASFRCSRSTRSGKLVFPELPSSSAVADLYELQEVPNAGRLYSYTIIHPSPKSGQPPFVLAYADFADQVRVFGLLELHESAAPAIGMPVRLVRDVGQATDNVRAYWFVAAEIR